MEHRLTRIPFFVLLMAIGSAAMMLPAIHALVREEWLTSRTFLYGSILGLMLSLLVGLATANYRPTSVPRSQLSALLAAFTLLPVMFGMSGAVYGIIAVLLGARFAGHAWRVWKDEEELAARPMFFFSILYLFLIFAALLVDRVLFIPVF